MNLKSLRYAKILPPNVVSRTAFVVAGFDVLKVVSGPHPSEEIVFHGDDCGSAHVVADALARYRSARVAPAYGTTGHYPVPTVRRSSIALSA